MAGQKASESVEEVRKHDLEKALAKAKSEGKKSGDKFKVESSITSIPDWEATIPAESK